MQVPFASHGTGHDRGCRATPLRRALGLGLLALTTSCAQGAPPAERTDTPDVPLGPSVAALVVDTVARGLEIPWGLAWAPDGRLFITERGGRIVVLHPDGQRTVWAELDVFSETEEIGPESGLLGIALAPDFGDTGHLFVLATDWRTPGDRSGGAWTRLWRRVAGRVRPVAALRLENRVLRLTDRDGRGHDPTTVIRDLPTNHYHAGGGLAFGPDSMLYVSVGDALTPELASRERTPVGKILRYRPDGGIPEDNPIPGSPVWARGLRNTQAFAWLPDGTMLGVEHGPSGMPQERGRAGRDELNELRRGADYGWPTVVGWDSAPGVTPPVWVWDEAIAPGGLAVIVADDGEWDGSVLVAGLRGSLERIVLERGDGGWTVVQRECLLDRSHGRLRAVHQGPDGAAYVTTSNRDARGQAGPDDDLVLRLRMPPRRGDASAEGTP
jgi:glucose/arabinose dehydrogenase